MLQVTPSSTIYMASTHIDFRKGTDGLCAICRNQLAINPLDGAIFLFYNRLKTSIKILAYDGQGFWLCSKRLSQGKFVWKSNASIYRSGSKTLTVTQICHRLLQVLINNGSGVTFANEWRKVIQTPT